jgi:hypothetical protein
MAWHVFTEMPGAQPLALNGNRILAVRPLPEGGSVVITDHEVGLARLGVSFNIAEEFADVVFALGARPAKKSGT